MRAYECVRGCAFVIVKMSKIAFVCMFSCECVFLSCECFCVRNIYVCVRKCVCVCKCVGVCV